MSKDFLDQRGDYHSLIRWIPSLEEQTKIGQFLYDIDSKIALNRQINDNLPMLDRSSKGAGVRFVA